jgi:hypothetical protein
VSFYNNANAIVRVNSGSDLVAILCEFTACSNYLWQGIESNGALTLNRCKLDQANFALNMKDGSKNIVKSCNFFDNRVGIYSNLISPFSAGFSNQDNSFSNSGTLLHVMLPNGSAQIPHIQKSVAGIYLLNFGAATIDFQGTLGTKFEKINNGIYAYDTDLLVNNAYFSEIYRPATLFPNYGFNGSGIFMGSSVTPKFLQIFPYQGIYQNTTFNGCTNGIYLYHSSAKISGIGIHGVNRGIYGASLSLCVVAVESSKIDAYIKGIELLGVDHANSITLNDNSINVSAISPFTTTSIATGIDISAFSTNNTSSSYIYLYQNRINIFNGLSGIRAQNISMANIIENRVTRNAQNVVLNLPIIQPITLIGPNPEWAGIKLENNFGAKVSCNEIKLGTFSGTPVNYGSDIKIIDSPKSEIISNEVEGKAFRGISFVGTCVAGPGDDSKIETNKIGPHTQGLHLSNTANIGPQGSSSPPPGQFNANIWSGDYITNPASFLGARNDNIWLNPPTNTVTNQALVSNNRIYVNPTLNPVGHTYNPENYPDNNPSLGLDWFFTVNTWTEKTPLVCGAIPPIISPISSTMSLSEAIALGLVTASEYRDQTKWVLNKNLLAKLKLADSLLFINDTLLQFFTDPSKANLKKLNNIEDTINHVKTTKDQYAPQITSYQGQLNDLRQGMSAQLFLMQDSLQQDSAYIHYELLKQDYLQLSSQKQDLQNEIIQKRNELALAGMIENDNFEPENYNEALSKTVNDIYYRTYGSGIDTLREQDIALLQSIIHICPQAGGPAVYRARALYMTVNDTMVYNDSLICRQANYFRESQEQWEQKAEIKNKKDNLNVYLYPNPAKDKLKVLIDGDNEAGIIKIYDLTGALIADFNVNKNSTNKELDISSLSEGYYMIHFSLGDYNKVKTFVKIK